jgi:hypothetical protein
MSWFWLAVGAAALWGFGYTINQVTLKHFSAMHPQKSGAPRGNLLSYHLIWTFKPKFLSRSSI